MTKAQAARYAHQWMSTVISQLKDGSSEPWMTGPDGPLIEAAVDKWTEYHRRRGPLKDDPEPSGPSYTGEPLPFPAADLRLK